jgi:para-aminobenzoate synthetase component 2
MLANWMAGAGHPVAESTVDALVREVEVLQKAAVA